MVGIKMKNKIAVLYQWETFGYVKEGIQVKSLHHVCTDLKGAVNTAQ